MLPGPVDVTVPWRIGSPAMIWLIVLLVIVALLVLALIGLYNRFVRYRNRVDNAWAQIEVQLKRRWDLIPNLVETVRGYAAHERGTFEAVTEARASAQRAQGPAATAAAEGILGQALGRLFAVAEAYPELQADENFRQLQTELAETENRIAVSRQVYNDTVLTYNNAIQTFPGVALAGPFGFTTREFFETDDAQREAPRVDFSPGAGTAAPSVEPPTTTSVPHATPGEPEAGGSGAPGGTS
jgi:LemA protein